MMYLRDSPLQHRSHHCGPSYPIVFIAVASLSLLAFLIVALLFYCCCVPGVIVVGGVSDSADAIVSALVGRLPLQSQVSSPCISEVHVATVVVVIVQLALVRICRCYIVNIVRGARS
ncbi:hypothetical protein H4582DRAFT_1316960 [Lactarius indigo]|nr:hypothetical protein H4582DRAFT_1316960 [Lactarius indigo]